MSSARICVRPVGFATLLAALVLLQFSGVVLGTESFYHRDFHLFGYPLAAWFRQSILAGEVPLWNPLNYCGIPFLAQWNTMVLYPPNWLNLLLPLSWSLSLFCVLHLYAGGLGMYFLAAHWTRNLDAAAIAGVAYAFNGLLQNCLMWPNNIAALGCLPWVLLTVGIAWRRGGATLVAASLVGALQMLSGAPEVILLTWVTATALAIVDFTTHARDRRRIAFRFIGVVFTVIGLAAAQLLPFLDLLSQSQRSGAGAPVEWSLAPRDWANFFVPLAGIAERHPTGIYYHDAQRWTHSYYAGLLPWLLLVPALGGQRSPRKWLMLLIVPAAFVLALGPSGHVYDWLNRILPLDVMRYPVKFIILTAIVLPLLAAFGLRRCLSGRADAALIPGCLAVAGLLIAVAQMTDGANPTPEAKTFINANLRSRMLILAAAGALLWMLRRKARLQRDWTVLILVLLTWLDLKTSQPGLAPTVAREQLDRRPPMWEQFSGALAGQGRIGATAEALYANLHIANTNVVAANNFTVFENVNLVAGLAKLGGFYSLWLPWVTDAEQRLHPQPNALSPGLADFLGVVWTMTVDPVTGRSFRWLPRTTALPLITAGQKPLLTAPDAPPDYLTNFNPRATVYLSSPNDLPPAAVPEAQVEGVQWQPHRLEFSVATPRPTMAVIAQADHHGWEATVDDDPTPILRANHGFQAVVVPEGEHRLVLTFIDRSFRTGIAISVATFLGLLAWIWRLRALRRATASSLLPADSSD